MIRSSRIQNIKHYQLFVVNFLYKNRGIVAVHELSREAKKNNRFYRILKRRRI
jgi:hypothetical protein